MAVLLESANSEYLSRAAAPYAQLNSNGLTLACWIRLASTGVDQNILNVIPTSGHFTNRHSLFFNNPNQVAALSNSGTTNVSSDASAVSAGTWHHVAAVFSGSSSRTAYIDGVAAATETSTRNPASLAVTHIGGRFTTLTFDGYIAHVAIWKRALSSGEVAQQAAGKLPTSSPARLWSYLPLLRDKRDLVGGVWAENGTVSYDQKIDPLVQIGRLGLHGGPRGLSGLFSPKAQGEIIKARLGRLGLHGGPRPKSGAFAPKEAGEPPAPAAAKDRRFIANVGRMMGTS